MPEERFITVTKRDAALRQLRTAIEIWFHDGDPVAIHTLVYAAHEIIHRMFRNAGHSGLMFDLDPYEAVPDDLGGTAEELEQLRQEFPKSLKADANFFKHADREFNPDSAILFSPEHNETFITICLIGLERLGIPRDYAGQTFKFWFRLFHPDKVFEHPRREPLPVETVEEWKRLYLVDKSEFFRRYVARLERRGIA